MKTTPLGNSNKTSSNLMDSLDTAYGDTTPDPAKVENNLRTKADGYKASSKLHNVKRTISKDFGKIRNLHDTTEEYLEEVTKLEAEVQDQLDDIIDEESQSKALADEADKFETEIIPKAEKETEALLKKINDELRSTEQQLKDADAENDPAYCKALKERITRLGEMQKESQKNLLILAEQKDKVQDLKQTTNSIAENIDESIAKVNPQGTTTNEKFREQFKQKLTEAKETLSKLSSVITALLSTAKNLFKGITSAVANVEHSTTELKTELNDMQKTKIEPTPTATAGLG